MVGLGRRVRLAAKAAARLVDEVVDVGYAVPSPQTGAGHLVGRLAPPLVGEGFLGLAAVGRPGPRVLQAGRNVVGLFTPFPLPVLGTAAGLGTGRDGPVPLGVRPRQPEPPDGTLTGPPPWGLATLPVRPSATACPPPDARQVTTRRAGLPRVSPYGDDGMAGGDLLRPPDDADGRQDTLRPGLGETGPTGVPALDTPKDAVGDEVLGVDLTAWAVVMDHAGRLVGLLDLAVAGPGRVAPMVVAGHTRPVRLPHTIHAVQGRAVVAGLGPPPTTAPFLGPVIPVDTVVETWDGLSVDTPVAAPPKGVDIDTRPGRVTPVADAGLGTRHVDTVEMVAGHRDGTPAPSDSPFNNVTKSGLKANKKVR